MCKEPPLILSALVVSSPSSGPNVHLHVITGPELALSRPYVVTVVMGLASAVIPYRLVSHTPRMIPSPGRSTPGRKDVLFWLF